MCRLSGLFLLYWAVYRKHVWKVLFSKRVFWYGIEDFPLRLSYSAVYGMMIDGLTKVSS